MDCQNICLSCVIDDLVGAINTLEINEEDGNTIVKRALEELSEVYEEKHTPSFYITLVHRIFKAVTGIEIPFKELRQNCNKVGIEISQRVREKVKSLDELERFKELILWAIAGNHLDFRTVGTGYGFGIDEIESMLQEKVDDGLHIDDRNEIFEIVNNSENILYIPDNVGEIAFDRVLVEEILSKNKNVTVPYRGGAITSDAIFEDFEMVGMTETKANLIEAGPDTLGISFDEMSDELRESFNTVDTVITKGQANFYVMNKHHEDINCNIICLLTTKCDPVSRILGGSKKINVAKVFKRIK